MAGIPKVHKIVIFMFFCTLSILFQHTLILAQSPIRIIGDAKDDIGDRLIDQLKEEIRHSSEYYLSNDSQIDGLCISISTIDPLQNVSLTAGFLSKSISDMLSAFSIVWYLDNGGPEDYIYITHLVGIVGWSSIDKMVENILTETDDSVMERILLLKEYM